MWDAKYKEELEKRRREADLAGGLERRDKQHKKGKLTAKERLLYLFDSGSFVEMDVFVAPPEEFKNNSSYPGDGVVVGYGTIQGRTVCACAQDFTVLGGSLGEYHAKKICYIQDMALNIKAPYIAINDSGGARISEGISSLNGYSNVFYRNVKSSGIIPQIAVVLGPCAGGACYSPAITDFVFLSRTSSYMFITGPAVVGEVTGEKISAQELGGSEVHETISGVAHFVYDNDIQCLDGVKQLLTYLPENSDESPPRIAGKAKDESDKLEEIVPDNQRKAYDVKKVIDTFADTDTFFEVQKGFAKNIVVGFARMDTETIGIVANQPMALGGSLDIDASEKAARFVRFCDCFNIPLLTLVDVPGFLPGRTQEYGGIIRRGAKLLYAYAEATVPKITLIMRKAYGGAYIAMGSKGMGADIVFAWPIAQTAVMGAEGAVEIMYGKTIAESQTPETEKEKLTEEYEQYFMNPYIAAEHGLVDEVILPQETRRKIRGALEALRGKQRNIVERKMHGNIPL